MLGLLGVAASACGPAPPPPEPPDPPTVYAAACRGTLVASSPGSVASNAVTELSGIVASRRNPGVWWVHNDSGDTARVFAIGDDGRDLGTFTLVSATNVDWEDIAVGPGPTPGSTFLYVGDIGDFSVSNGSTRASIVVYRVPEPALDAATAVPGDHTLSGVDALTLTYPGGARYDAEALLVDPLTGELYVITKDWSQAGVARVFRAPANLVAGSNTVLTEATSVSLGVLQMVTGADVTPAGDVVALRTDTLTGAGSVVLFPRPAGGSLADAFAQAPCDGAVANEAQGEALGFTPDARGYVTAGEGPSPALHRFTAP